MVMVPCVRAPPPPPVVAVVGVVVPPLEQSPLTGGLIPRVIDSVKLPVVFFWVLVVFTRIVYVPVVGNVVETRAEQPGPASSSTLEESRPSAARKPRTMRYGSKSSDDRSTVSCEPAVVLNCQN